MEVLVEGEMASVSLFVGRRVVVVVVLVVFVSAVLLFAALVVIVDEVEGGNTLGLLRNGDSFEWKGSLDGCCGC
jgi:hypothetical protein